MVSLRWYLNRLSCMSAGEVAFRLSRRLRAERLSSLPPRRPPPAADTDRPSALAPLGMIDVETGAYCAAADAVLSGRQPCLSIEDAPFGPDFGWARDPKTGVHAPLTFGMKLNYKDERLVGDIKYLWEPNRHLHFPTLAQAYRLSGDDRYLHGLAAHLSSWIDQNPYLLGPNWSSSLEAGIRLINWSLAWRMLGSLRGVETLAREQQFPLQDWMSSVYRHLEFIDAFYSGHSSANNHLIGEAAGVYIAALTWPYWHQAQRWRARARAILEEECDRQIAADGVDREQAVSYQAFVLELLLLAALSGAAAGERFLPAYTDKLALMADFLAELLDEHGRVPQIGDSDDALVVELAPDARQTLHTSLVFATGRIVGRADLEEAAGGVPERARWLCALAGLELDRSRRSVERKPGRRHPAGTIRSFPHGGYHLLHAGGNGAPRVRVLFDTGPLGYLSIAAHGHADALAILLWVDGQEVLVDSGTYAYHTEGEWRAYFRGTRAHNTVTVDGLDQSESGGSFMWTRHASAWCEVVQQGDDMIASGGHDGYRRLADPVTHSRTVKLDAAGGALTVIDSLHCNGRHAVEIWWHFSERCDVNTTANTVRVTTGDSLVEMRSGTSDGELVVRRGATTPPGGWISRRFGAKMPTTSVGWKFEVEKSAEIQTHVKIRTM